MKWYKQARGIGKSIYPIRVIGYILGAIVLYLYKFGLKEIHWLTILVCIVFLLHPHVSFFLYHKKDFASRQEIKTLMFDTFLVGLFVSQMNFSIVPSVAFFTVIFSTAMGVNGVKLFLKCLITFLAGLLLAVGITGFVFDPNPPLLIQLLSITYLLFGTISHNYFDFQRSLKFIVAKDQIKEQKIEIEQNLQEKEVLLREVHHRVKNNLQIVHSLLNLQQENILDEVASQAIQASQNRIKIMSLVHQELYKTDEIKDVNISEYLLQLINYLKALNEKDSEHISIETKIDPASVNLRTAVPLGLIINEIISNSLEHAFDEAKTDNKIWLHITNKDGEINIEAGDNGSGIQEDDSEKKNSLGLSLIKDLVRQLKGKLHVELSNGVIYKINFPLTNE